MGERSSCVCLGWLQLVQDEASTVVSASFTVLALGCYYTTSSFCPSRQEWSSYLLWLIAVLPHCLLLASQPAGSGVPKALYYRFWSVVD